MRLHGTLLQSNTFSKFCQHLFSSAINNQTFLLPLDITIKFFYNLKVEFNKQFRGVAQLVARLLWEQDVGSSSLFTPTIKRVIPFGIALFIFVMKDFNSRHPERKQVLACFGQHTRPPPVAETGSVCWRSGRRNRASEQRDDFFGHRKRRQSRGCRGFESLHSDQEGSGINVPEPFLCLLHTNIC